MKNMKKAYIKPTLFYGKEPAGLIPVVAGVAAVLGVSQAVAGLALGSAAGLAAVGGATALAKKAGNDRVGPWERLPALDIVDAYV
ncbi:MAG: hypothetical protein LBD13_06260 [Spirochaetaceae bacterium]|jgi:hypothetical protein|nr:hypothetical protein [Spirochaetaceae bacterium]